MNQPSYKLNLIPPLPDGTALEFTNSAPFGAEFLNQNDLLWSSIPLNQPINIWRLNNRIGVLVTEINQFAIEPGRMEAISPPINPSFEAIQQAWLEGWTAAQQPDAGPVQAEWLASKARKVYQGEKV